MELTDYQAVFNPRAHIEYIYNSIEISEKGQIYAHFVITSIHQFFTSHAEQFKTTPLLSVIDYGCGSVIANVISAAQYTNEIVLAEYTDSGRACLQQWIDNKPGSFDWSHCFSYIVQELEGKSKEEAIKREIMLRNKIKAIVPCDITKVSPISPQYSGPHDILINILMIDTTCTNIEDYEKQIKSLATLIKPGGYLVFMIPCTIDTDKEYCYRYYMIGEQRFNILLVTKPFLKSLLEKVGFEDINITDDPKGPYESKKQGNSVRMFLFITARKK